MTHKEEMLRVCLFVCLLVLLSCQKNSEQHHMILISTSKY